MGAVFRCLARQSGEGHIVELPGVSAVVEPASPERSVVNSVTYSDASALGAALDRLAEEYERAGVRAWTVWVPEHDHEAAELLERAGHLLDARPAAMIMELADFDPPPPALDLADPDMAEAARINDAAYGFAGDFERAFQRLPAEPAHLYLARAEDLPACTVLTYEEAGECGIYFVATLPEARGRGLATALMSHALLEARARGCTSTSLQATARGRPLYLRMGYRQIGVIGMWERRKRD